MYVYARVHVNLCLFHSMSFPQILFQHKMAKSFYGYYFNTFFYNWTIILTIQ